MIKNILYKVGIVKSTNNASAAIFEGLFGSQTFFDIEYATPHEYVCRYWDQYSKLEKKDNSTNGKIFEYIIATLFIRENILPFYLQAKVAFVPNVEFDNVLYQEEGPIAFSIKTSLRERYKQADLEAVSLKYVHRRSKCFLLTLDDTYDTINQKISKGDIIGLDACFLCFSEGFDKLIEELKKEVFSESKVVKVVESDLMVNEESIKSIKSKYKMDKIAKIKAISYKK